ncbi:flagellar basal-body MS-ring/collar protein FliF [Novosphingobium album (ex Liu et al. 2023)]|uniref:Flagellar M-ring protein n=1 Tax=Novosphingobium album (ex Liu et al. 2023) TaxID=3031130 RepID=A0ABT5WM80_9SPHN|nr:flagellar basal-body MS-ring/collar protein FliF [Novosphingobium album (ex Liu et al. 2023)]MDE8651135.1 flagellar basal-body MS-ring/collar protein FliF [Novosphingobium album (ex Liu et al. 2023)]
MADLVPAGEGMALAPAPSTSLIAPFTDPRGGSVLTRLGSFAAQPAIKRMVPWFLGVSAIGAAALAFTTISPSPQRTLYSQLDDNERANVVGALDQAAIPYTIDNDTGALTVDEGDFYRARMLVAQDGALATPESGDKMLDSLPMGASRTLEGERLRSAREHDMEQTIQEIDGVESVRVHIAEGEKSVFVRDNAPPTASVMVRLARGRSLSDSQVQAITNLVAGSVPGLSLDAVRVIDQHGRLLSEKASPEDDRLDMQARMEEKLRAQVSQLLTPMLGDGNFTTEIQVELDMDEVTSARESYDKDGVVRSETQQQSQSTAAAPAAGVPGVLANTPPPATQATAAPPQGTQPPTGQQAPSNGESSSTRTYELGREVSVANQRPGGIKRVTVAVALSQNAMKGAKPQDIRDIEALVGAAVGANPQRGDQVKVVMRSFEPIVDVPTPFYETAWFAMVVRYGAAVLAVLLVLLLGVRPLVKAVRGDKPKRLKRAKGDGEDVAEVAETASEGTPAIAGSPGPRAVSLEGGVDVEISRSDLLSRQVGLAQQLVSQRPDSALQALRQMLNQPEGEAAKPEKAA